MDMKSAFEFLERSRHGVIDNDAFELVALLNRGMLEITILDKSTGLTSKLEMPMTSPKGKQKKTLKEAIIEHEAIHE